MLTRDDVAIHLLLYGDFPQLHQRVLNSIHEHAKNIRVRAWCNQVCERTAMLLATLKQDPRWLVYFTAENRPKYKVMRQLFDNYKRPEGERDPVKWAIWMDDDSYITDPEWFPYMAKYIEDHPDAAYIGKSWYVHHLTGQQEFIAASKWFKGVPWELCPTKKPGVTQPGISFAQGSYWWLKTDVLRQLDWPDERLNHNGGDTLLGEAVRQQGLPFHKCDFGVKLNAAARRGYHEAPAGSADPKARR